MPRIEPYTQQTSVSGIPGTPTVKPLAAGAEALQTFGEIGTKAALLGLDRQRTQQERDAEKARLEMERQKDAQDASDAFQKVADDHLNIVKYTESLQGTYASGDPRGYTDQVVEQIKTMRDATLKTITNPKARVHAETQYASMAGSEMIRAVGWEHVRKNEYSLQQYSAATDSGAAVLATDYNQFTTKLEGATALANMAAVPGMTQKMIDDTAHKYRIAASEGQLARDPAGLLAATNVRLGLAPNDGITAPGVVNPNAQTAPPEALRIAALEAQKSGKAEFQFTWTPPGAKEGVRQTLKVDEVLAQTTKGTVITTADPNKEIGKSGVAHIDALTPPEVVAYRNKAIGDINSGNGIAKANIASTFADMKAMADRGLNHPNPPTDEQLVTLYGPQQGATLIQEKQRIQAQASQIDSFKGMPESQIRGSLAASAPGVSQAQGFAPEAGRQGSKEQSATTLLMAREKDAGAWVAQNSSAITPLYTSLFTPGAGGQPAWSDPTVPVAQRKAAMDAYFTASAAEQTRLEIKAVSILPDAVKEQVARMATMSSGSGDRMAQDIRQMSEVFGDHWQQAYKEVLQSRHATSIPASWIVLSAIPNKLGAEQIARLDGVKIEDMKKQLPKGADKTVDENVQAELATWSASMMGGNENTKTYGAVREVATKWAYNAIIGGTSVGDAVKQGVDMVIGHYEFSNAWSVRPYAIPKDENPALVTEGVDIAMRRLHSLNLTPPPDMTKMRTKEEAQREFAVGLQSGAMWVTNEKEDGLLLFTRGKNGEPIKVMDAGGQQVDMKFDTLRAYATEARALRPTETTAPREGGAPGVVVGGVRYKNQDEATAAQAEAFRRRGKVGQ